MATLLSQILIALTISLDNEFEHRMPHTTTMGKKRGLGTPGPWLVSWPLWANFLRFVDDDGVRLGDLRKEPGVGTRALGGSNPGMVRWGYVRMDLPAGTGDGRIPLDDMVVRVTSAGRMARQIWQELPVVVEPSWREALGGSTIDALRNALVAILDQVDLELPRYISFEAGGRAGGDRSSQRSEASREGWSTPRRTPVADLDLTALLSQVLELFTREYEAAAGHALFIAANALRVIDPAGTPERDLPRRSGIAKESVHLMIGPRHGGVLVTVVPDDSNPKQKVARLTPTGIKAKATYGRLPDEVEDAWAERFGKPVGALRTAAEAVVGGPRLDASPSLRALIQPRPDGWRSWIKPPETLPHHPQPNHRGAYPDGV
jgi:hypothetical protein